MADWLAGGGVLRDTEAPVVLVSPRRKGIRHGAKLLFFSIVLTPIFLGLCFLVDDAASLVVPFAVFLAGLAIMLYSRLFGEETPPARSQPAQPTGLATGFGTNALPPSSNIWTNSVAVQQVRTAELAKPPSVTEHTTKLLDND